MRALDCESPPPPYWVGQVGVAQPLSPIAFFQACRSGLSARASVMAAAPLPASEGGKLAASQALASFRNSSSSRSAPKSAMAIPPRGSGLLTRAEDGGKRAAG